MPGGVVWSLWRGEGEEGEREREERGEEGGRRGEERERGEGGRRREWGRMRWERRYVNGSSFRPAVSVTGVCVCDLSHLLTTPDITLWMTLEVSATEEEKETVKAFMQYNLLYSPAQRARRLETEVY